MSKDKKAKQLEADNNETITKLETVEFTDDVAVKLPSKYDGYTCYKKRGGGSCYLGKNIIKPGQKFWARENEIPKAFIDLFEVIDGDTKVGIITIAGSKQPTHKETDTVKIKYVMTVALDADGAELSKGGNQLYNVVDESGKAMNEKPLREQKAKELLAMLNL